MIVGKKKPTEVIERQLVENQLSLSGVPMKREECAKYLGDWLSCRGLADSVALTVKKRTGLTKMAIFETRAIIDDCRSAICGGLVAGITLWESAILPSLLYNSECWLDMSNSTLQQLESLQLLFYRVLLSVGTGCPIPALYWDTGALLMKYRILKRKLLLLHHIATLPANSLANQVYEVQSQLQLPGLQDECNEFLLKT